MGGCGEWLVQADGDGAGWAASIAVLVIAFAVALWIPVAGLALLPLSGLGELLVARRAPQGYKTWA